MHPSYENRDCMKEIVSHTDEIHESLEAELG